MKLRSAISAIAFIFGANAVAVAQTNLSAAEIADAKAVASRCVEGNSGMHPKREILRTINPLVDDALRHLESQIGRNFADHEIVCISKTSAYIQTYQTLFRDFCADPLNSNNMLCEPTSDSPQR